jgi:hypothetical protein
MTGKQRMLNAYRGLFSDRVAIAPEFWYYYPARLLGVDMIEFLRSVPFHQALKKTFETFGCEGWGIVFADVPSADVEQKSTEHWVSEAALEVESTTITPHGTLTSRTRYDRKEPAWSVERPIKVVERDLAAWEHASFGQVEEMDVSKLTAAWEEVGDSYLLEAWMGAPFFDFYAGSREGGLEAGILDFMDHEALMERLQEKYIDHMVRKARVICTRTPLESLAIGCAWSCNSLIGPAMWRRWDKPVIAAVAREAHRHGRLLHIHFHGKCIETAADFAEIGIDCVCPFERPPGGDVVGLEGLKTVERLLAGKTTMNGNIHTVETLIRGTPADVRREVREVLQAFAGNPRVILGSGDQVGYETPEENLHAMIDEAKRLGQS